MSNQHLPTPQRRAIGRLRNGTLSAKACREELHTAACRGWATVLEVAITDLGESRQVLLDRLLADATFWERDRIDATRVLLEGGANPNANDVMQYCGPLTLPLLVQAGGDVNGKQAPHPLIVAIERRTKQDKALQLIELGADVNATDGESMNAVMHAACLGRNKVFDALVARGADLYCVDAAGRSAARHLAETLINCGKGATASDARNAKRIARELRQMLPANPEDSLLLSIVLGDALDLASQLQAGLDPNTMIAGSAGLLGVSKGEIQQELQRKKQSGESKGFIDALLTGDLLPTEAEQDQKMGGLSLLMWATAARQPECVDVLVSQGANTQLANSDGLTALKIAESRPTPQQILASLQPPEDITDLSDGFYRELGISQTSLEKLIRKHIEQASEYDIGEFPNNPACMGAPMELSWELAGLYHLAKRYEECKSWLTKLLDHAQAALLTEGPSALIVSDDQFPCWIKPFGFAVAAAAALGDWRRAEKLMAFPHDGCSRGQRSPTWNVEWYQYPIWRHLAELTLGNAPGDHYLEMAKADSTRLSKAMLAVLNAITRRNAKQAQKAIERIVTARLALDVKRWKHTPPSDVLCSEATFFLHFGRHNGLDIPFEESWKPYVLPDLSTESSKAG